MRQPHAYIRNGTAKMLTLFHPATGKVRVKGVTQSTNAILHPWLKEQVEEIVKTLPEKPILDEETNRQAWKAWQQGLSKRITLAEKLPPLRMLLIWDNLQGHYTPELVLCCAWRDAAVYALGSFMVEYGRVYPAHFGP